VDVDGKVAIWVTDAETCGAVGVFVETDCEVFSTAHPMTSVATIITVTRILIFFM
jgi:hypothetical protein